MPDHRANLAIFNSERRPLVEVDVSGFLEPGGAFRLMNPRDFYGAPVRTGTVTGRSINVPVDGEFAAFVVMKE